MAPPPPATKVRSKSKSKSKAPAPVWQGPEVDGITQSLLSRFIVCRERFRLLVVEGLRPADEFNHRIEYGQMWHTCEEAHAAGNDWHGALTDYCKPLARRYRTQQEQVQHWYNVCKVQFPVYVEYWRQQPDVKARTPILQETTFAVNYLLPSDRTVLLRGKWDSVDIIGKGKAAGIYLQENKTKGDIVEEQLQRQLQFDLQTMIYLTALHERTVDELRYNTDTPIRGVRYNVVRRPLSGGRHSIRQHKPSKSNPAGETADHFYDRLGNLIEGDADYFFMRFKSEVSQQDITHFKQHFLNPVLEQLCDWWESIRRDPYNPWLTTAGTVTLQQGHDEPPPRFNNLHWQHPYGVYNPLTIGRASELDEYLATGSELGLDRVDNLFPEL